MHKLRVGLLIIIFSFIFSSGGTFVSYLSDQSIAKRKDKVTICHIPPDDPANYHEINVPENAIPHHLSHGDCPGPCVDSDADGIPDCNDLCPNGMLDPGEECDDGNNTSGDGCSSTCTLESVCGDGTVEGNEECDDGNNVDGDGCQGDCTLPSCGNRILEAYEQCDPPGDPCDGDSDGFLDGFCDTKCQCPTPQVVCGDGFVDPGEFCDDGFGTPCGTCNATCSGPGTGSICGDGVLCPDTEPCDDGINNSDSIPDACRTDCTSPTCGDGVKDSGEECDDGNSKNGDGCRANCTEEICGDGIKDPQEQCDDGNDIDTDNCTNGCILPKCGDGNLDPLERCDDGGESATCDDDCSAVMCGDGKLNQTAGEECDDGNTVSGDGCHGDCTIEGCGDGIIDSEVFVNDGVSAFYIDTYEASRPDADSVQPGVADYRACSSPDKLPWVNATWTEADAACTAAGKRLCTEEEWQLACEGTAVNTFPYGDAYDPLACNGKDYDPDCSPPDMDMVLPTGTDYGCPTPVENSCESEFGAFDMSGNVREWTATQVSATPPTYQIRGGSYDTVQAGLTCQYDFVSATESFLFSNLGFRCCRDPQCSDGVLDGTETDVDCGGSDCQPCVAGKGCIADSDCQSNFCAANVCQPTSCGNGVLDAGEDCDNGTDNSDSVPDACRTNCTNPFCGDNVVDTGEQCDDGNNVSRDGCSAECLSEGGGGGTTTPVCGNGVREGFEQCDGTDLGGATCSTLGYSGGMLNCNAICNFDTSGCL